SSGPPAFELKFLLSEDECRAVEDQLRSRLALDPHADPAIGNAYLTTSVYTDTPRHDVYFRVGPLGRRKYRVRRYGDGGPIFLGRRARRGDRVQKRRSGVAPGELAALAAAESPPQWDGAWFHRQLVARQLRPVCRIAYERVAYTGLAGGNAVRVTFDRNVRGVPAIGWDADPVGPAPVLLDGRVICEFKFRLALPALFKGIVQDMQLTPSGVSKYRLFMQSIGLPGEKGKADA